MKKCKGCEDEKPIDEFGNDKQAVDGKTSKCKECRNNNTTKYKQVNKKKTSEYNKKYSNEHKELKSELNKKNYEKKKIVILDNDEDEEEDEDDTKDNKLEIVDGISKKCSMCEKIKLLNEFGNRTPSGNKYKDGYDYNCKECMSELKKNWKDKNKDHVSEYNEKYRKENKEKVKAYYKKSDDQKSENIQGRQIKYFTKLTKIVEQNGGTCLGTVDDYENAYSKILIKCGDNHEWDATLNNLNTNRWCPICKTYTGELVAMSACKYLFQKSFKKVRPRWLKNNEGNNLELDMYNEDLKLAIEYNGIQHYQYISFFHKTEDNYKKRVDDDNIKIQKCKEKGINLINIPYTISLDNICEYISNEANRFGIISIGKVKDFDYSDLKSTVTLTKKIQDIIEIKGGKLLEGVCSHKKSRIVIQCEKNHVWSAIVKNIQRDSWCHDCGLEVTEETKAKISTTLTTFLKTEKGKQNKQKSLTKRSETMEKQKEEVMTTLTDKKCNHCQETKKKEEFGIKKDAKDGLQTNCKNCVLIIKQEWRQKQKTTKNTEFKCDECDKSFQLKDSLTRHKKEKHTKPISLSKK